jgi:hypothetical protein
MRVSIRLSISVNNPADMKGCLRGKGNSLIVHILET